MEGRKQFTDFPFLQRCSISSSACSPLVAYCRAEGIRLGNGYFKIMCWSICSQCFPLQVYTILHLTKAIRYNSNTLLPGPHETPRSPCPATVLHTDVGKQQQSWKKNPSLPLSPVNPIHFYIKAWFQHKSFYIGGFEGFYVEPVSMSSMLSLFTKAVSFV